MVEKEVYGDQLDQLQIERPVNKWQLAWQKYHDLVPVVLFMTGLIILGYGMVILLSRQSENNQQIVYQSNTQTDKNDPEQPLVVDIGGAVVNPGVYQLSNGSRLVDGLAAAGGMAADADREWVSKNLNLSDKLADSAKIYVPRQNEHIDIQSYTKVVNGNSSLISINSASNSELEKLPGVGPVTAAKIVDARPYRQLEDLTDKKVISRSLFQKIQKQIAL